MDRPLKFKKLAHELLVHSDDFEIFAIKGQNAIDALSSLGDLEQLTRDSFKPLLPQPAPEPVLEPIATAPPKSDAALNQKVGATFVSARIEYKSALKDPSLVDALLAFHRGALISSSKSSIKTLSKSTAPATFAHASIPEIEANPKRDTHFRKSSASATKVLRS